MALIKPLKKCYCWLVPNLQPQADEDNAFLQNVYFGDMTKYKYKYIGSVCVNGEHKAWIRINIYKDLHTHQGKRKRFS